MYAHTLSHGVLALTLVHCRPGLGPAAPHGGTRTESKKGAGGSCLRPIEFTA